MRKQFATSDCPSETASFDEQNKPRVADPPQARFTAILPNFKLIDKNGGTKFSEENDFLGADGHSALDTFSGALSGWTFGLIQRGPDLHVHFRSASEDPQRDNERDWRHFQAFLDTLAFLHGQHAWPLVVEHRCDTRLILDRMQMVGLIHRIPHTSFSETLAHNAKLGRLQWNFGTPINKLYEFLTSEKAGVDEARHAMYLLREACADGVPSRIRLLSLCSLLESLVRSIYAPTVATADSNDVKAFEATRATLCAHLQKGTDAEKRISRILKSMDAVNIKMRFEAVWTQLAISWPSEWEPMFKTWSRFRNPLSHRLSADSSSQAVNDNLVAESRLAGAINCVLLRLAGYVGVVRLSTVESRYINL